MCKTVQGAIILTATFKFGIATCLKHSFKRIIAATYLTKKSGPRQEPGYFILFNKTKNYSFVEAAPASYSVRTTF